MLHTFKNIFKVLLLFTASFLAADLCVASMAQQTRKPQPTDTLTFPRSLQDFRQNRRMSASAYPVRMQVDGKVIRIHSDYNQILPIYTQSGTFYMAMRLSKGTNWLSGLPHGRYFINNRLLTIK